jgi:hypothetical protein
VRRRRRRRVWLTVLYYLSEDLEDTVYEVGVPGL